MNIKEAYYSLALFDSMNGLIEINSGLDVEKRIKEYRSEWRNGFEFSSLFDSNYYLSQVKEIDLNSISPLEHYIQEGHSLYDPSHFFDTSFYIEKYSSTQLSSIPMIDYALYYTKGKRAFRNPSPFIDVGYYLKKNKDVAQSKLDPLAHYLRFGAEENRKFHPFLSLDHVRLQLENDENHAYLLDDQSLLKFIIDFNLLDRYEPSPLFSNKIYRASLYRSIIKNPFYDFLISNHNQCGNPNGFFDSKLYISLNPTVNFDFTNPLSHYISFANPSTTTSHLFNGQAYLELNDDIARAKQLPLEHFLTFGFNERRYVSVDHKNRFVQNYRQKFVIENAPINYQDSSFKSFDYIYRSSYDLYDMPIRISHTELIEANVRVCSVDFWDTLVLRNSPHWAPKLHCSLIIEALLRLNIDCDSRLDYGRLTSILKHNHNFNIETSNFLPEAENINYMQVYKDRIKIEAGFHKEHIEPKFESVICKLFDQYGFLTKKGNFSNRKSLISYLRRVELNYEINNTSLNFELFNMLKKIVGVDEKIIVISDYYHDAEYLRAVLESHLSSDEVKPQFEFIVSSDYGVSKLDDGKLYGIARKKILRSSQKFWIHFGDNAVADIRNAYKNEISSVFLDGKFGSKIFENHYEPSQIPRREYEDWASNQILNYLDQYLIPSLTSIEQSEALEMLRNSAIKYASIKQSIYPVALVIEAISKAYEYGEDTVVYLSREGKFLCRIHEKICSVLPLDYRLIRPIHAETSRRSLFSPAFAANEKLALGIFSSQYPDASIYALLRTICPSERLVGMSEKLRDSFLNISISILSDRNLSEIIGYELYSYIVTYCENQNILLKKYFLNKEIFSIRKTALICDIGWRGTMQDLLKIIYAEIETTGIYLGLFPYKIPQFSGTQKFALVFNGNEGDLYSHIDPPAAIERPWTPNVGSCVRYSENENEVFAVCDESDCTVQSNIDIALFQNGVIEASLYLAQRITIFGIPIRALKSSLEARLFSYYTDPTPGISELWFDSIHDDTFGSGLDVYKKIMPSPKESSDSNFEFLINNTATSSKWTQGYNIWSATIWYKSIFN